MSTSTKKTWMDDAKYLSLKQCIFIIIILIAVSIAFTAFLHGIEDISDKTLLTSGISSTGALLVFQGIYKDLPSSFEVSPALFGYSTFSGSIEGILILPANETYHKECPKCGVNNITSMCDNVGPEPLNTNPYIEYLEELNNSMSDQNYILIIDRGDCYFTDKVYHARLMKAAAVIVCDSKDENLIQMWQSENDDTIIDIPSVLLSNDNCDTLLDYIGVTDWNPTNIENMTYPAPDEMNYVTADIQWGLPHINGKVKFDLWTSSDDHSGAEFIAAFEAAGIALSADNYTVFKPHMFILNGSAFGCDQDNLPCETQCSNNGRYCAASDIDNGIDGM